MARPLLLISIIRTCVRGFWLSRSVLPLILIQISGVGAFQIASLLP